MLHNPAAERPYDHILHVFRDILSEESPDFHIRKVITEDILLLDIREEQKDTFDNKDVDLVIRTHAWLSQITPMQYTIFHKESIFLLLTIMPLMSGIGEISFLVDNNFVNASKEVKKALLAAFHKGLAEVPFRRIEAKVKDDFVVGRAFVERMGMQQEGVLRKYGPSNDYIMYSLIR